MAHDSCVSDFKVHMITIPISVLEGILKINAVKVLGSVRNTVELVSST